MRTQKLNKNGLTDKECEVFDYIRTCISDCGYPPTVRDIGKVLGLRSSSSIQNHLVSLERKGYIRKDPEKPRTIEILKNQYGKTACNKYEYVSAPLNWRHSRWITNVSSTTYKWIFSVASRNIWWERSIYAPGAR